MPEPGIDTRTYLEVQCGTVKRNGKRLCWQRFDYDRVVGVWRYRQCAKCGLRRADANPSLYGPLDWSWLETGSWTNHVRYPKPEGLPPRG
jgi:hypothetical protein